MFSLLQNDFSVVALFSQFFPYTHVDMHLLKQKINNQVKFFTAATIPAIYFKFFSTLLSRPLVFFVLHLLHSSNTIYLQWFQYHFS